MPLQATSGAASYDAFGGGVPSEPNYIESVFSCFLYTGNGSTQTITNGIDLSGKGGLVWRQGRSAATGGMLIDTARGIGSYLISYSTDAAQTGSNWIDSFNSNGFTMNSSSFNGGATYASWTFRKQPKFFDVVTYTGNGTNGRTIAHNLGSVPGCIIVKTTNTTNEWAVYHRSLGATKYLWLNDTTSADISAGYWNDTTPTSSVFTVGDGGRTNGSGNTYVAYLFAHNAGGFGLTGTDNVISCGSYVGNNYDPTTVTLGYEPQWVMIKRATGSTSAYTGWAIFDNMRGMPVSGNDNTLLANTSDAENPATANGAFVSPTATGFTLNVAGSNLTNTTDTFIYIAIRRGPMKVPTSGTSVFAPSTGVEPSSSPLFTAGFSDMTLHKGRIQSTYSPLITDRLRGKSIALYTSNTNADSNLDPYFQYDSNAGAFIPAGSYFNNAGGGSDPYALYAFRRAPSFFDEVCYTGTGSNITLNHNLGAVPQLMIFKTRTGAARAWGVYSSTLGVNKKLILNTTAAVANDSFFVDTTPTATVLYPGNADESNEGGNTYVAYLFATCAGVSKVGSYTGNGSSQTINCGFTGGARFVMIKATSTTGDWMVADSARGIVSGNDPYLELNNTNAEVTGEDWLDTDSTGFVVNQVSSSNANTNGVTYIFFAVA